MATALPTQLTFRGMRASPRLEAEIHQRGRALRQLFDRLLALRVVVESKHRQKLGRLFHVRLELHLPGGNIFVGHESHDRNEHEDPYVAVRAAFDAAARQLEDRVRVLRGEVKGHVATSAFGRVVHVSPPEDFGFIRTREGQNVYFHRNSLIGEDLEEVNVGDQVRFTLHEENDAQGPHASGVRMIEQPELDRHERARTAVAHGA